MAGITHQKNMRFKAMEKHRMQRFEKTSAEIAESSVTLPNWNAARVRAAQSLLKNKHISVSKTEILLFCVRAYLPKLRLVNNPDLVKRTRRKNESRYGYRKISTYCKFNVWDHLFQKCLHNKISISQVFDIAVRLYLRGVLQQLLMAKKDKVAEKIKKFINLGKYQKFLLQDNPKELKLLYFISRPPI